MTNQVDIAIIGGGIAGLWTLNRLRQQGYQAILVENQALGCGQTIKAQGIIHGGIKYALTGKLTASAKAMNQIPLLWQQCLDGRGEIDLSQVEILSPYHYLWSTGGLLAKVNQFLANKVLSSHSESIGKNDYPALFQHPEFKGQVYRVAENVISVPNLLTVLAKPYQQSILKCADLQFNYNENNNIISSMALTDDQQNTLNITAQRYIFTAGESNQTLCQQLSNPPAMQRRPLHMVVVKLPFKHDLYAHCIANQTTPRLTVTSHKAHDGKTIWYLGGGIAEEGIKRNTQQQIEFAKQELANLFPWLNFSEAKWASFFVDRAEVKQPGQTKPESTFLQAVDNAIVAWPTKLAFAPKLAQEICDNLQQQNIQPGSLDTHDFGSWPTPAIAQPIWDQLLA